VKTFEECEDIYGLGLGSFPIRVDSGYSPTALALKGGRGSSREGNQDGKRGRQCKIDFFSRRGFKVRRNNMGDGEDFAEKIYNV
jgi:hypothetical protein